MQRYVPWGPEKDLNRLNHSAQGLKADIPLKKQKTQTSNLEQF